MNTNLANVVHHISRCTIKPLHILKEMQKPYYLTPWDLQMLTVHYIQTGLLFIKPQNISIQAILDQLKVSLSSTLTLFYPLSGRLVTKKTVDPPSYCFYIDCKDGAGVEFVHAVADTTTISDILTPIYVPSRLVESLFTLDRAINHDAHSLPLLSVQVTELVDGIFIGCSFNHIIGDGLSFWHFFNSWSQVSKSREHNMHSISCPPITKRWFLNNQDHSISLPFSHPDEFLDRYIPQPYQERIFHFTSQSVAKLKAKANADISTNKISSFQAVAALVWRSLTRARGLLYNEKTECLFPINDRSRLDPPLSEGYFGNCILTLSATTTVGELLINHLGWVASLIHKEITDRTNIMVRSTLAAQTKVPILYNFSQLLGPNMLVFGMSPRFNVYTNDFGWGAPVAVRSGYGLKFDGKITWYPGREGGGSMDLEICLCSKSMGALELDDEFMAAISPTVTI